MQTIFMKFPSESVAIEKLQAFRGVDDDGNAFWITDSNTHRLYPAGVLHKPSGNIIEIDGVEVPELVPLAGWHVNFQGEVPEAALPYVLTPPPDSPIVVFG